MSADDVALPNNLPNDCTLLVTDPDRQMLLLKQFRTSNGSAKGQTDERHSWSLSKHIHGQESRLLACWYLRRQGLSLTIRGGSAESFVPKAKAGGTYTSGYAPPTKRNPKKYANSIDDICRSIWRFVSPGSVDERRGGLLLISGATNAAKSHIARGLIHLYLAEELDRWRDSAYQSRKPHLITFEDPIETLLFDPREAGFVEDSFEGITASGDAAKHFLCHDSHPDYTPRELGKDVTDLTKGIEDALRQTPTIYYVSETRRESDWRDILHLAESHVVVTTAHASSLLACFSLLRRALKIRNPQGRGELAQNLLGVIHLRASETRKGVGFVLPGLWRRTAQSIKAFAADGPASIVPMFQSRTNESAYSEPSFYAPGRSTFADFLGGHVGDTGIISEMRRAAVTQDLRGE